MEMIESRNRSTHAYHKQIAIEIAGLIVNVYVPAFQKFETEFLELEKNSRR